MRLLKNFQSQVYMLGLKGQLADSPVDIEKLRKIVDLMQKVKPDYLFLEMSKERYQEQFETILAHPRFDVVMGSLAQLLRDERPEALEEWR